MKQWVDPESTRAESWPAATVVARLRVADVRTPDSVCMETVISSDWSFVVSVVSSSSVASK
jgi:hypothetical protein